MSALIAIVCMRIVLHSRLIHTPCRGAAIETAAAPKRFVAFSARLRFRPNVHQNLRNYNDPSFCSSERNSLRSRRAPHAGATASWVPEYIIHWRMAAERRPLRATSPKVDASAPRSRKDQIGIVRIFRESDRPITAAASIPISRKEKISGPPTWCSCPAFVESPRQSAINDATSPPSTGLMRWSPSPRTVNRPCLNTESNALFVRSLK